MQLHEKYRPKDWDQVIGQAKAVARVRRIIERPGFGGAALWVCGPSGVGKTTLARIVASKVAKPWTTYELDGESCTVDAVREAVNRMQYYPLSSPRHCWIVNEAQAMTARAVQAWLTALDPVPDHVVVVFTTTADSADLFGEYDGPFMSRCLQIQLTSQGLCRPVAARLREIAAAEGLDGQPVERYEALVKAKRNNIRACIQAIEAGDMLSE